jgi:hypothetical protein
LRDLSFHSGSNGRRTTGRPFDPPPAPLHVAVTETLPLSSERLTVMSSIEDALDRCVATGLDGCASSTAV